MTEKMTKYIDELQQDRRRDIISAFRDQVLRRAHHASYSVHKAFDGDTIKGLKLGRYDTKNGGISKSLRNLRRASRPWEVNDYLMTLEASRLKAQASIDQELSKLNRHLTRTNRGKIEPLAPLTREEAQSLVKEASDAWRSGVMNFEFGDTSVDAYQNGAMGRDGLPGQFRPDLRLPGKLFRQE